MSETDRPLPFDQEPQGFTPFECPMNDGFTFATSNKYWQQAFEIAIPEADRETFQNMLKEKSAILWEHLSRGKVTVDDVIEGLDIVNKMRFEDAILDLVGNQESWEQRVTELEAITPSLDLTVGDLSMEWLEFASVKQVLI